jgi:hypothetical protein
LLGIILICGVKWARVQIPLKSGGRQAKAASTLKIRGTRMSITHKKRERGIISYVSDVVLLKRYLRSSTGSQE